jgi:hypothetical protein
MPFVAMQLKSDGLYANIFESPDLAAQDLTDLTVLLKKQSFFHAPSYLPPMSFMMRPGLILIDRRFHPYPMSLSILLQAV